MQETIEEIVRKSRKDKSIVSQNIEIEQTFVERPQLTTAITTKDEKTDDKSMLLQMLQKRQRVLSRLHRRRRKK